MPTNPRSVPIRHSQIILSLDCVQSEILQYSVRWYSPCKPLCVCRCVSCCLCAHSWGSCPIYTDRAVTQVFRHWPRLGRVPLPPAVLTVRYLSPSMGQRKYRIGARGGEDARVGANVLGQLQGLKFLENGSFVPRVEVLRANVCSRPLWIFGTSGVITPTVRRILWGRLSTHVPAVDRSQRPYTCLDVQQYLQWSGEHKCRLTEYMPWCSWIIQEHIVRCPQNTTTALYFGTAACWPLSAT